MTMDKKLEEVLRKVELLCDQNIDFANALRNKLGVSQNIVLASNHDTERIEKYLGLDYALDSADSVIDYSFVQDDTVRNQLIADNREMMRFRYGTRYHAIDFCEFCHYCQLQAEMLLNYYYSTKFNSLDQIKNDIQITNEKANVTGYTSLLSIPFIVKIWSCYYKLKLVRMNMNVWMNIKEIRNNLSHRAPEKDVQQDLLQVQQYLESMGFPLKNGMIDLFELKKDNYTEQQKVYESKLKNLSIYKRYCLTLWQQRKDFDEVAECLSILVNSIKDNL